MGYILTNMAARGCLHEGCVAIVILVLHICPSIQKDPHHIFIPSTASIGQGSVANTTERGGGRERGGRKRGRERE